MKPKRKNFEDALDHYSKIYGSDTFNGKRGSAWGIADNFDNYSSGNHDQLKSTVNDVYEQVKRKDADK